MFLKSPEAPNITLINTVVTNATPVALENFVLQTAVPPVCFSISQAPLSRF